MGHVWELKGVVGMSEEPTGQLTRESVIGYLLIIGVALLIVLALICIAGLFLAWSIPTNLD